MLFVTFIILCVSAVSTVIALPSVLKDETHDNEVQSYNFVFYRRDQWQARTPTEKTPLQTPVPYVLIHHTYDPAACYDKEECSLAMRQMQNIHMDIREWWDIGYNLCVGSDGAVYEARGWETVGAQSPHFNSLSIGICLIGDWETEVPPAQQLKTAKALIEAGVSLGYIRPDYKLVGHRQVRNTVCPGDALYHEIQSWDHYTPFPSSYKDLVNVKELPESVKQMLLANSTST